MLSSSLRQPRISCALQELCEYKRITYAEAEMKQNDMEVCENPMIQQKFKLFDRNVHILDKYFVEMLDIEKDQYKVLPFNEIISSIFSWERRR